MMSFVFCAAAESEKYESTEILVRSNTKYEGELASDGNDIFFPTTEPRRGALFLEENGRFSYIPDRNFKGRDYFGYRIRDGKGEVSEEKTVIIRVQRS